MNKIKKVLCMGLALVMLIGLLVGCGGATSGNNAATTAADSNAASSAGTQQQTAEGKKVELEIIAVDPEFEAQDREIWSLYEEQNPNVTIKMSSINEDQAAALDARIAAGNAPAIQNKRIGINKDNYKTYVNLLDIDFPYWDKFPYDYKKAVPEALGIEDGYVPVLNPFTGRYFSFVYYKDEMEKAGLDPRTTVRTMDDLDKFLADLKAYRDKTKAFDYVWDFGWSVDMAADWLPPTFAVAMGYKYQDLLDTYAGKTKWTDENGPYAAYFKKMKEYYDKGYLPEKFWTRSWDKETEAGFIAKKSIMMFHGPWIFAKTEAADANAKLSAFPFPGNKDGIIWAGAAAKDSGVVIFAANKDKPEFPEIVKAFIWYNSPEIVKLRCEAMSFYPDWDLSNVGGVNLKNTQYTELVKALDEGAFGSVKWGPAPMWPQTPMAKYAVSGKPDVLQDDAMAVEFGKYWEGKTQLKDLLEALQKRWEDRYKLN